MEALAALGVAAAVIQFVDFAHQTCNVVKHALEDGADSRLQQISFASTLDDFKVFLKSLKGQEKFAKNVDHRLFENDRVRQMAHSYLGRNLEPIELTSHRQWIRLLRRAHP